MTSSRKPNPRHITRDEHVRHEDGARSSHYQHNIPARIDGEPAVRETGRFEVVTTYGDYYGDIIYRWENGPKLGGYSWSDEHEAYMREQAARGDEPHHTVTWTVGHVVWPDDDPGPCPDCPHGR